MSFERQHQDLKVFMIRDRTGRIVKADLAQDDDLVEINTTQLYALVDDVAVADPDEWARRFPPQEETELALRRVADYFRQRAEANRKAAVSANSRSLAMAWAFDLAVTRIMEEIEALYPDPPEGAAEHLNNYHQRRRA